MYTSLHRALRIEPGPLTMDLIRDAVTRGVVEREDLDWKRVLPKHPGTSWTEEFSKDVAAMANAGGGMIVYGVGEDSATSAAKEIFDIPPITDGLIRELRAAAFSGITPPVLGLRPVIIQDAPESGQRVLALLIPASDDSPHLVFRKDMFGAPLRLGTQTGWMKERMLESAYRLRFAARDRRSAGLDELFNEAAEPFGVAPRVWMVAVASPAVRTRQRRMERNIAHKILSEAANASMHFAMRHLSPLDQLHGQINHVVPGLRRWTIQSSDFHTDQIHGCRISIHFDGSVSIAMAVGGDRQNEAPDRVQTRKLEAVLAELAGIALTSSRELTIMGGYSVKASLVAHGIDPIYLMEPDQTLTEYDVLAPIPVSNFAPVTGTIPTDSGTTQIVEALEELALDLLNQAGVRHLGLFKPLP